MIMRRTLLRRSQRSSRSSMPSSVIASQRIRDLRCIKKRREEKEFFCPLSVHYGAHRRGELVSMRGEKGVGLGYGCIGLSAGCLGPWKVPSLNAPSLLPQGPRPTAGL
jgi:hypothetical protein